MTAKRQTLARTGAGACAMLMSAGLALSGPAHADAPKTCATAHVWNHRGDSSASQTPVTENTVKANAASAAYGLGIETDVWQSRTPNGGQAEFYINHDATWTRTASNSTGYVAQMTPAQNAAVTLADGTTPPTLAKMLAQSAKTNTDITLELKNTMSWDRLYQVITANISLSKVIVLSESQARVSAFRTAHPDVTTGWVSQTAYIDRAAVAKIGSYVFMRAADITPNIVTKNSAAGLSTVSRSAAKSYWPTLLAAGADLIVESSKAYKDWCGTQ